MSMKKSEISAVKRLVRAGHSEDVRGLLLTPTQDKALSLIDRGNVISARYLGDSVGMSINHSNNTLAALVRMGYVRRDSRDHPSGGREYLYTSTARKGKA